MKPGSVELALRERGIPTIMPGEDVPQQSKIWAAYDPHGQLLSEDPVEGARLLGDFEARRKHQFLTLLTYQGRDLEIVTTWLALNHNYGGGPPLVWETQASSGDWLDFTLRYSTEAAARNGHLTVTTVLLRAGMQLTATNVDVPSYQVHTIRELDDDR